MPEWPCELSSVYRVCWQPSGSVKLLSLHLSLTFGCCPEKLCLLHALRLWAASVADIWLTKYRSRKIVWLFAQFTRCDKSKGNVSIVKAPDGNSRQRYLRYHPNFLWNISAWFMIVAAYRWSRWHFLQNIFWAACATCWKAAVNLEKHHFCRQCNSTYRMKVIIQNKKHSSS